MAPTRIADIIIPELFNPYVIKQTMELSALVQAGIISNNPELDSLASGGGKTVNMPFWEDLTGTDEVLSDTTALTPTNITTDQDVAVLLLRGKAWAANDLAAALSGSDPMGAIASLVASWWARMRQKTLLSILKGVFLAGSMSGNLLDISGVADPGDDFTASTFIDAVGLLGDAEESLTAIAVHSATLRSLMKQDLIDFDRPSTGVPIPFYMGKQVIVDDGMPVSGSGPTAIYTTYLFGPGAIGLGNGAPPVPTEVDRDVLAGDDILVNRQHYILHPRGVKFTSNTVTGAAPTNTELETAANWLRVWEPKALRVVCFKHHIAA